MVCASEVGAAYIAPEKVVQKDRLKPGRILLVDAVEVRIVDDRELKLRTANSKDFAPWLETHILHVSQIVKRVRPSLSSSFSTTLRSARTPSLLLAFGFIAEQLSLLMLSMGKDSLGSMRNDAPLAAKGIESIVMSLETDVEPEGNLLQMKPEQCHRILVPSSVLDIEEMNAMKNLKSAYSTWPLRTIGISLPKGDGLPSYQLALERVYSEAMEAIADGVKMRDNVALMIETGEAHDVHHCCVLLGYGTDAICPLLMTKIILKVDRECLVKNAKSVSELLLTIFEIMGYQNLVQRVFAGTAASRAQGATYDLLAMVAFKLHETVMPESGGYYWRDGGESHIIDPAGSATSRLSARRTRAPSTPEFATRTSRSSACTFAACWLQVEPWNEIVRRFVAGAMSYGSTSMEAHSALAVAMNHFLSGKSNMDEGGEDAERSNVASGRFGVTSYYLAHGALNGGYRIGLISPPLHHDIHSIERLKQLHLRSPVCESARASVREAGVRSRCGHRRERRREGKADHIDISGYESNTGAARWIGIKARRITVQTYGQIGRVATSLSHAFWAQRSGARYGPAHRHGLYNDEEVTPCVKIAGQPEQIINFFRYHVGTFAPSWPTRLPHSNEMAGSADMLKMLPGVATHRVRSQDRKLVSVSPAYSSPGLTKGLPFHIECDVTTPTVLWVTSLPYKISKHDSEEGLPKDIITSR
ncbi:hypothetical protein BD626DRAFT_584819 [Schizophyllum amplum]|uniref:glutamate synthase (ferredoxin) n=1 Tax=Schizophyllum amplum TaxID=97359 RepID=A0A550C7Y1_9AGAR|nr:hypothetical protein BD626DRAFT_584819 [Auriculariopsis ampla]